MLRHGGVLLMLLAALCPEPGSAQFSEAAPRRQALLSQEPTNLFATWKGMAPLDGLLVELPAGWKLEEARVLRFGYEPVDLAMRSEGTSRYVLTLPGTVRDPFDLVLRVQTGSSSGTQRWSVVPFSRKSDGRRALQTAYRFDETLRTRAKIKAAPDNHALAFYGADSLLLRRRVLPALTGQQPYTVSFWMRTHALGTVVFSTWNGEERQPYPLEGVVSADGRLSVYRGRRGLHESMTTTRPLADEQWHHVAITHDPRAHRMRLYLDGAAADSLQTSALPALSRTRFALGGRPGGALFKNTNLSPYSGLIDEFLMTPVAQSTSVLSNRLGEAQATSDQSFLLSFEKETWDRSFTATNGASKIGRIERVPARRDVSPPVTDLRVRARDQQIELIWQARPTPHVTFYVERSINKRTFKTVGKLSGEEAAKTAPGGRRQFHFTDRQAPDRNVLYYRVRRVTSDQVEHVSRTIKVGRGASKSEAAMLFGSSPNPFSTSTTIAYRISQRQLVRLSVWDLSGHQILQLVNAVQPPDRYEVTFHPRQLPSGTYFARLQTPTRTESLKMTLVR